MFRARSGQAQRARRLCAEGTPRVSPSAPVRALTAHSASTPGQNVSSHSNSISYTRSTLLNLSTGLYSPACVCIKPDLNFFQTFTNCTGCQRVIPKCFTQHKIRDLHNLSLINEYPKQIQLKCILLNARSLVKHSTECALLIEQEEIALTFITESWMDQSSAPDLVKATPPGYYSFNLNRPHRRGGSLAVIYRSSLNPFFTDSSADCEALDFLIHITNQHTFKGTLIYRPPGTKNRFLKQVSNRLEHEVSSNNFTMLGDFNFHLDNLADPDTVKLLNIMNCEDLKQLVSGPTHSAGHTLEGIFSNLTNLTFIALLPLTWSDHHAVVFNLHPPEVYRPRLPKSTTSFRSWNKVDGEIANTLLSSTLPEFPSNLDEATATYNSWVKKTGEELAPFKNALAS